MTETLSPRRRRRWWIIPLVLVLLVALLFALRPAIERWSWERALSHEFGAWRMDATSENNIIIAGRGILHYNGLWWRYLDALHCHSDDFYEERSCYDGLTRVWAVEALDRTHIYAACEPEGILRFNGLWWAPMPGPNGTTVYADQLWAQSTTSIYALDYQQGLMHSGGRDWNTVSLPNGFDASYVGGNSDCVVVLGETEEGVQGILVKSSSVWDHVDVEPFLTGLEPNQWCVDDTYCEYSVRVGDVWALNDGRIIVGVWEKLDMKVINWRHCLRSLVYDGETWSTIEPPAERWKPKHIMCDDDGYLLAYGYEGDRYRQVESEDGSGLAWRQLDAEWPGRILGNSLFFNTSELLVYGGSPYTPIGVMDVHYLLTKPYRLEHYELTW